MTKIALIPIYGKNTLQIYFPGTSGLILRKLGMKHWRRNLIIAWSKDNPGLTLTYFMARSNFATKAFMWGRCDNDGFFGNYCSLWH